jgi:hypothetical protein
MGDVFNDSFNAKSNGVLFAFICSSAYSRTGAYFFFAPYSTIYTTKIK